MTRPLRVLHTADWHLGQVLHGISRAYEHACFFSFLENAIAEHEVDVLVVAGDVFDVANPGPGSLSAYYGLLARLRSRFPELDIVIVGGNHDSHERLDAPRELLALDAFRVSIIGGLPEEVSRAIIPLRDRDRRIAAWLLAVPFLRRGDVLLRESSFAAGSHEHLIESYRALYQRLADEALSRGERRALLATGHCYMIGGQVSDLSERKIQVGNQHALPLEIFPEEIAYVALGHLHRAQSVLGKEGVRYSGSPIPLSFAEKNYEHQVLLIDFLGSKIDAIRKLYVPRAIDLVCLPEEHRPLPEVLDLLRSVPHERPPGASDEQRPWLEVRVQLDAANTRVRHDIEEVLRGAWPRLLRIDVRYAHASSPSTPLRAPRLDAIAPEQVFEACYLRQRPPPVPDDLRNLFLELVEEAERQT
jgi:DNA repair protein SbcD/Mre11